MLLKNIFTSVVGVLLCGCWQSETPIKIERPVKLSSVESLSFYDKDFAGTVASAQTVNLAFQVGGLVNHIYVGEGSTVRQGELLATLDSQDYQLQLESDLAKYQTSKSILERTQRLADHQAVSVQEFEIAQSDYEQARSNYQYSRNRLNYTRLTAPFAGSIEKQAVDTYQEVSAGTIIFRLINPNDLEIKFTLPESDANMLLVPVSYKVEFDNLKGRSFSAKVKSVIDGSVAGAGIPITLGITDPGFNASKLNIKVGFTARVIVELKDTQEWLGYTTVPLSAIFTAEDDASQFYVWVYDDQSSSVARRRVERAGLTESDKVIIKSGLEVGENVVSAGVYSLIEGEKVKVLQ